MARFAIGIHPEFIRIDRSSPRMGLVQSLGLPDDGASVGVANLKGPALTVPTAPTGPLAAITHGSPLTNIVQSFEQCVGTKQERFWNREAHGLRSFQVDR